MGHLDVRIRHGGDGGPAAAAAVIVLLLFIAVGVHKEVHQIVHVVEIVVWTVFGVAGTAAAITGGVLTTRTVRRARARRTLRQATYQTATVIPPHRPAARRVTARPAEPPALDQPQRRQSGVWPLPGWWEEIRPRIGGDGDEHRPR